MGKKGKRSTKPQDGATAAPRGDRNTFMRTGVLDSAAMRRFPEVNFASTESREPVPFLVDLRMSVRAQGINAELIETFGGPHIYQKQIFLPRGIADKLLATRTDMGVAGKVIQCEVMDLVRDDLNELGTWKCCVCNQPTKHFLHRFALHRSANDIPGFTDNECSPVCRKPQCSHRLMNESQTVDNLGRKLVKEAFPGVAKQVTPKPSNLKVCSNCFQPAKNLVCSKCGFTAYCSKECQVQHWKGTGREGQAPHKMDCKGKQKPDA